MTNQTQSTPPSSSLNILSQSEYEEIFKKKAASSNSAISICSASTSSKWDKLPLEIIKNIASYADPKDLARIDCTSKACHQAVNDLTLESVKKHPTLKHIYEHSSAVQSETCVTQKWKKIAEIIAYAEAYTDYWYAQIWPPTELPSPKSLNKRLNTNLLNFDPSKDKHRDLLLDKAESVGFGQLFTTALLLKDTRLGTSFDPNALPREALDFAAIFFLRNKQVPDFKKILPFTSFYDDNEHTKRRILEKFLDVSSEEDLPDAVNLLVEKDYLCNPNSTLVLLSQANAGKAIPLFLERNLSKINCSFIPNNENPLNSKDGLHTALMSAAAQNCQEAFEAILHSNLEINYQILKHIRDLLACTDVISQRIHYFINQNQNRQAFIEQLEKEMSSRFPNPHKQNGSLPNFSLPPAPPE